jgi:homoserine dehydrogenase
MGEKIVQTVSPCLVPMGSPIAEVSGVFNAVFVEGDFVDKTLTAGRGAGEGPTASAVVADIIDLARAVEIPPFGVPASSMSKASWADAGDITSHFYLHVIVLDRPGVLADISAILRDHNVSMESIIQRARDPDNPVSIVMTSHEARQADIRDAVKMISELPSVDRDPCLMKISRF